MLSISFCYLFIVPPKYTFPSLFPVYSGTKYLLVLNITSLPYPNNVVWTHNGNTVQYETTPNSILFNPLSPQDNGTYTVESYNEAGNGTITFDLIVYCKLSLGI